MAVIEAYVTNLGKYNEGELASALLKFPTTREAVQEVLKQIGIDNIRYEEIFIADYDGDLSELNACLGEYESIDELNHLACLLSELDKSDLEKFEAVVASGEHTSGAGDLINLAENLDCYDFYIGVSDDETLGRIYAEDMEMIDIPENLRNYFDYDMRRMAGICGSMKMAALSKAVFFFPTAASLSNTTTGGRTSRRTQGFCLSTALHPGTDGSL